MSKGKKTCSECKAEVGCRTLTCKCGHIFLSPKKVDITQDVTDNEEVDITSNEVNAVSDVSVDD